MRVYKDFKCVNEWCEAKGQELELYIKMEDPNPICNYCKKEMQHILSANPTQFKGDWFKTKGKY